MSESKNGTVEWMDLTVPDAESLTNFYTEALELTATPVEMDGYSDYCLEPPGGKQPFGGICHARGNNEGIPPQWIIYITVANLEERVEKCLELGGELLKPPGPAGDGRFCLLKDPAGAVFALYQAA